MTKQILSDLTYSLNEQRIKNESYEYFDWAEQEVIDAEEIHISEIAKKLGFGFPVKITRAVWNMVIEPTEAYPVFLKTITQNENVEELLHLLHEAIRQQGKPRALDYANYTMEVSIRDKNLQIAGSVAVEACFAPGEHFMPIFVIRLPDQD